MRARLGRFAMFRPTKGPMADDTASRIKRIDDISSPARTAWFTLLGVLAFVAVTLLSITHADILLDARMIALPLVGVSVPTNLFLLLSPIVLTVLYANLHLYLLKLWQAFRRAPTDAELGPERAARRQRAAVARQRLRADPEAGHDPRRPPPDPAAQPDHAVHRLVGAARACSAGCGTWRC